jgi:hypothetical protein
MLTRRKRAIILATLVAALLIATIILTSLLFQPSEPATARKDFVGICVHNLTTTQAQQVQESGAKWIRIGASDALSNFSASIQNAKAQNLQVLAILDSWMFNQSSVFTLKDWTDNVAHYVSQYADYVDAWEIYNEPTSLTYPLLDLDLMGAQNQTRLTAIVDFYAEMVQTAAPIIRQYDPTAKILLLGGCHLYTGGDPQLAVDEAFAEQLAAKGIAQYGDGVSLHAYPWNQSDLAALHQNYAAGLAFYRNLFGGSLEVWVTETGKPLEETAEAGQATYLADALDYFDGQVDRVFWYLLQDYPDDAGGFGLIGVDGKPRLAYGELQKFLGVDGCNCVFSWPV